jgi:hypothetical protein
MTRTLDTYTALRAGGHAAQPLFKATIEALCKGSVDTQSVLASMASRRNVDTAVGVHLDAIGEWVGLPRYIFVPTLGTVTLADVDYRVLLRARIQVNHWNGEMESLQVILSSLFPGTTVTVTAYDLQDMSMNIFVSGGTLTPAQEALLRGGLLVPKPSAVRINGIFTITGPVFGLSQQDTLVAGPDFGSFF